MTTFSLKHSALDFYMINTRSAFARATVLTLAAVALAACGESTSPLNVSPDQLQSMGESIAAEMEGGVMQLTAQDVMSNTGGAPSVSRIPVTSAPMLSRGLTYSRIAGAATSTEDCGVPSQNPPVDSDGDMVPDNFSVTFALPACHIVDQTTTIDITGTLNVTDPQPGTSGLALNFSLDHFRLGFSDGDGTTGSVTRHGSGSVSAAASGLSQTENWIETAQITGVPGASATIGWSATFAAAQGQSITAGNPLPDGTYTPNGSVSFSQGNRTASFSVETITPLQYSAACAAGVAEGTSISPFSAGKVRVTVTSSGGGGTAEVTYAGCNAADVFVSR